MSPSNCGPKELIIYIQAKLSLIFFISEDEARGGCFREHRENRFAALEQPWTQTRSPVRRNQTEARLQASLPAGLGRTWSLLRS
jgi:hypothetical protein